jgi:hypothetical protein
MTYNHNLRACEVPRSVVVQRHGTQIKNSGPQSTTLTGPSDAVRWFNALWMGKRIYQQVHTKLKGSAYNFFGIGVFVIRPAVGGIRFVGLEQHHTAIPVQGKSLWRFAVVFMNFWRTAFGKIIHDIVDGMISRKFKKLLLRKYISIKTWTYAV